MPPSAPNWLYAIVPASFICVVCWKFSLLDLNDAFKLAGRCVLFIAFYTWIMAYLFPLIKSTFFSNEPSALRDDEETRHRQILARNEMQEKHHEMASHYQEFVLKPRQEKRETVQKKQTMCKTMAKTSWRLTVGHRLRGGERVEHYGDEEEETQTPNREALRNRKLPEHALPSRHVLPAAESVNLPDQHFQQVVRLPEEPADDARDVVRLALKCPSGRTILRRFLKSDSSTLLLHWMQMAGYHPTIYTISTSYPRRQLQMLPDLNMEEVGLMSHTFLYIEEKDPSTT